MSLKIGFIRRVGTRSIDEPYYACITGLKTSEELSIWLHKAGSEDWVEAFVTLTGPFAERLESLATDGQEDIVEEIERILTQVYLVGRRDAMTDPDGFVRLLSRVLKKG